MAIELFGTLYPRLFSEAILPAGPAFDAGHIERVARAHEEAGFDGVLLPHSGNAADNFLTAAHAASVTRTLRFLLAHRPGFIAPTLAARKLATLDQLTGGRLSVHIISGGRNAEQQRDGDFLEHDARYERSEEYVEILRRIWSAEEPISHSGNLYHFVNAFSDVKPRQQPTIPISIGGASDAAIRLAARHGDIFALWGETLEGANELISRVRTAAHGRAVRFALSFRVILGDTEEEAWKIAREGVEQANEVKLWAKRGPVTAENTGTQRLLKLAEQGEVLNERLFTGLAKATGAPGNTTALVGTAEQVADAILKYHDIGITIFLFRGLDPRTDAADYGRRLVPLLRERTADRPAREAAA